MKEVIYECIRGLDGKIPCCKLGMNAKCFNEIQKSLILDHCCKQNGGSNRLDPLKRCCHNSLRDLCVYTDVAWWKLKKHSHKKDIGNYSDGCIICLKSFYVGCVLPVKKGNDCMVCSTCYNSFLSLHFSNSY